ncbi:MAG: ABC transporter permease [Clostridia bacterium]|nr:ABC transporter permease [Clostridia bacterium]MBR0387825.1 ABC transporter permease [Clostridia bacterium]MBR2603187.1 ABC transporter permease [Clostridia bacterium]MBR2662426.1 ABC transporter permease [Clostridia bacterium]
MPEKQLFEFAEYHAQDAEKIGYSNYSYWKSVWQNFLKNKAAVIMACMFILLFIFTFVASAIGRYDIYMAPDPQGKSYIPPNGEYWFGTNAIGQDYWAQVWYATRASILLAVLVSVGQITLGVIIGLVWGYVRKLDRFFTELYNLIDNIPTIIYMTLIALMVGKNMLTMGIAMVGFGWLATARNVRNLVFMYRDREYNLASRCLGTKLHRILFRNIFPYLVSVIILRLALAIPGTIAYETTLTYLGLMDIMMPSLGNLLASARAVFPRASYTLWFPAAIVSIITITFYLVGNAFSDACDPRNHV